MNHITREIKTTLLNLSHLPIYTVKAIQEQQALIEQLLQRIEQLENK